MPRPKSAKRAEKPGKKLFINVEVSNETRDGLHQLKEAMGASSQSEVIERLVKMGVALQRALQE